MQSLLQSGCSLSALCRLQASHTLRRRASRCGACRQCPDIFSSAPQTTGFPLSARRRYANAAFLYRRAFRPKVAPANNSGCQSKCCIWWSARIHRGAYTAPKPPRAPQTVRNQADIFALRAQICRYSPPWLSPSSLFCFLNFTYKM